MKRTTHVDTEAHGPTITAIATVACDIRPLQHITLEKVFQYGSQVELVAIEPHLFPDMTADEACRELGDEVYRQCEERLEALNVLDGLSREQRQDLADQVLLVWWGYALHEIEKPREQ